jgi:mannose-6-phosphate isomerase-like protein (cupin superfamily)
LDSTPGSDDHEAERVQRYAERPGFRITELRMSPTQQVGWHRHTNVRDTFYVLEGRVRVTWREPDEQIDLGEGESWGPASPGRPHQVTNLSDEVATFFVLQGLGEFDFVSLTDQARQ